MITFKYKLINYHQFLADFSKQLGIPFSAAENAIQFPPAYGEGYITLIELKEGINAVIYQFQLKDELLLLRKRDLNEYYTLIYEEVTHTQNFTMKIGSDLLQVEEGTRSAMYLTSFLYDLSYVYPRNSKVRGLRILVTPEWLKMNLNLTGKDDVLKKYIEMKTHGVLVNAIDPESKEIFAELMHTNENGKNLLFYKTRILKIIERFGNWLYRTAGTVPAINNIHRKDINAVIKAEKFLTNDLHSKPPPVRELAKMAGMSITKFKICFSKVYGSPPFLHFQKHRMEVARQLLLSGGYSVKNVGYSIGYFNLSNFTKAFKKQYGKLPSDLKA